ncbi:hypothetical protein ACFZDI_23745 [Streptomyces sp. NPDC007907]|uniref:hypothetical protein n=1 Tax=Streptomyces sp. NPDC007907 TaxID=3364789 RepID=UPI0036E25FF2
MSKNCFVIMPIRKPGTPEHEYFRTLRDVVIDPVIRNLGFTVTRADDIAKGGAIVSGIVQHLAHADLVIADLTDLNPNVFYELGVRHALRGKGTVMMVDTTRSEVPFDLKPYRMIEFGPDLKGIEKLRELLDRFARAVIEESADTGKDSPVHDGLPSLPENIFAHAEGSVEGELREENARLRQSLSRYGMDAMDAHQEEDASAIVSAVLSKAQRGELPADLFNHARVAAQSENRAEFLSIVMQLVNDNPFVIGAEDWSALASDAHKLSLPEVSMALRDRALELRPNNQKLKSLQLAAIAHSEDPRLRRRAREELASLLKISWDGEEVVLPEELEKSHLSTFGMMLDAYHRDGLDERALKITTALIERFPDCTIALRNHGRALSQAGRKDEALKWYRKAVLAADVDDTSPTWFANELSFSDRLVDSIENYLRASELDPQDAEHFAQVAEQMAEAVAYNEIGVHANQRSLPEGISRSSIIEFLAAAFSCPSLTSETLAYARSAALVGELGQGILDDLVRVRQGEKIKRDDKDIQLLDRKERLNLTRHYYELVQSDLTKAP